MFAQHAVTPEALAARFLQLFLENLPGHPIDCCPCPAF